MATKGRRRGHVLVVDGEHGRWIQHFLAHDHDVELEHFGSDVIRRIDGGSCFDLILCDVMLPDCTGPELCARLAERHPDQAANVVFITDGSMPAVAREAIAAMPNLCIRRPFDADGMRALVWRRMRLGVREVAEAYRRDGAVDEASDESFPASDPPAFTAVHAGPPSR